MIHETPLQDLIPAEAPIRHCFGCGADNPYGLRIKSFLKENEAVSTWRPEEHHCSYPGYLNGGVACTLIDCHAAWAAFALECREQGIDISTNANLPTGWTRAMKVEFLKPTPLHAEITLRARVLKKGRTSRTVACSLFSDTQECVRAEVTLVMNWDR
ncbi:MAG TPA: PaaI family thioesterase [Desulfomonilaceae bacterium]|nr:PaaI family thioesterase [Desulfomonilaceae bacterium]